MMTDVRKPDKFNALIDSCRTLAPARTAVAHPCDETSLAGAVDAGATKIIMPTLVGPEARILALAAALNIILTSRADSVRKRMASCAAAALLGRARRAGASGGGRIVG